MDANTKYRRLINYAVIFEENSDGTIILRMAQTSSENGAIGNFIREFQALDIPYLITSIEQADAVFMVSIGDEFLKKLSGVQI